MNTYRKNAIIAGVLYITGTIAGILSLAFTSAIHEASDKLPVVASNPDQLIMGALCVLLMGLSLAMIPAVMFPVLKKYNEILAVGYVIFRGALETVTYIAMTVSWLLLIPLSRVYADGETNLQALGTQLLASEELSLILNVVFCIGALLFYSVLFQSKLVPRWLSGWGLIALVLYFAAGILPIFGMLETLSTPQVLMNIPLAIQEMVLALWLIIRGFSKSSLIFDTNKAVKT